MGLRALLLIVDVQNGFVDENTEHVIEPISELITMWRKKKLPIVFSKFINPPGGPWERLRDWHELKTAPETDLHPQLRTEDGQVFEKSTYSAWSEDVVQICNSAGLNDVIICGIDTNECVLATAIDVFESGVKPWVVKDCCASGGGQESHNMAITLLETLLGKQQIIESKDL